MLLINRLHKFRNFNIWLAIKRKPLHGLCIEPKVKPTEINFAVGRCCIEFETNVLQALKLNPWHTFGRKLNRCHQLAAKGFLAKC